MLRIAILTSLVAATGLVFALAARADDREIPKGAKSAVVAGGCFWCVESDFEKMDGIYEAVSGYAGGTDRDATYRNHKGHREVVEIYYDPAVWDYGRLVRTFLRTIDVTDPGGQFCDRGFSYTTALHYRTDAEKADAEAALKDATAVLGTDIATVAAPLPFFVEAEGYHQDYYKKNPLQYRYYRSRCGRDDRVKQVWGEAAAIPK